MSSSPHYDNNGSTADEHVLLDSLAKLMAFAAELRRVDPTHGAFRLNELVYHQPDAALADLALVRAHVTHLEDAVRAGTWKGKGRAAASGSPMGGSASYALNHPAQSPPPTPAQHHLQEPTAAELVSPAAPVRAPGWTPPGAVKLPELAVPQGPLRSGSGGGTTSYLTNEVHNSPVAYADHAEPYSYYNAGADGAARSRPPAAASSLRSSLPPQHDSAAIYEAAPVNPAVARSASRPPPPPAMASQSSQSSSPDAMGMKGGPGSITASMFPPVDPTQVRPENVYVAFLEHRKSDPTSMDINLKAGDKVRITCVMDGNEVALGINVATGAEGTFPLACITQQLGGDRKRPATPGHTPTLSSSSAQQTRPAESVSSYASASGGSSSSAPQPGQPGRYLAVKTFNAQNELETSLKLGDEVDVMFFGGENGETAYGLHRMTKIQGAFPASHLRLMPDAPTLQEEEKWQQQSATSPVSPGSINKTEELYAQEHAFAIASGMELPSRTTSLSVRRASTSSSAQSEGLSRTSSVYDTSRSDIVPADSYHQLHHPHQQPLSHRPAASTPSTGDMNTTIKRIEEENDIVYREYWDTTGTLKAGGKPVPLSMNLKLMKDLTSNIARQGFHTDNTEERLRERAAWADAADLASQQSSQHLYQNALATPRSTGAHPAYAGGGPARPSILRPHSHPAPHPHPGLSPAPIPTPPVPSHSPAALELASRRRAVVLEVINELRYTEERYANDLRTLVDHIMRPLLDENVVARRADVDNIFKNVPELARLAECVARELDDAARVFDTDPFALGPVFLKHVEEWNYYVKYVENYAMAKKTIRRLEDSRTGGEAFKQFLEKCRRKPECNRVDLSGFLILPIQRISRYWLLLQRLRKHCDQNDPAHETIEVAEQYMLQMGSMLDYAKRRDDDIHRMFEIATEVENFPTNLISFTQRRFVKDFEVEDCSDGKRAVVFLFSDCFLVCGVRKPKDVAKGKKFDLRERFEVVATLVGEDADDGGVLYLRAGGAGGSAGEVAPHPPLHHRSSIASSISSSTQRLFGGSGANSVHSSDSHLAPPSAGGGGGAGVSAANAATILRFPDAKRRGEFTAALAKCRARLVEPAPAAATANAALQQPAPVQSPAPTMLAPGGRGSDSHQYPPHQQYHHQQQQLGQRPTVMSGIGAPPSVAGGGGPPSASAYYRNDQELLDDLYYSIKGGGAPARAPGQ
ncbi:Protein T2 [Geranomyces variabilis]|uniref:Protein T2 n=1 Tax=Geranomyces variabilis TaxID=109894 RepID=A0AAD5TNN8_9FUNG|nr:Protein T2 [Geranomyces variabilis]